MSNIYSAKFMHEASTTLESKVIKRPVKETYLFSTMKALNEMNSIIDESTKKLYIQISEAESKEEENKLFADYFYQFKSIFGNFANKVQEMKSRMVISIENKVETWEDLYEDDGYISCFDKEFSYSGYNFLHIEDPEYPRLHLQKLYQKEFDHIGQLMQDTRMSASPSVKLKIIATVCNNFAKSSGDKNWIKDLIHDMIDVDDKEMARSYSECIYNSLRDKHDFTVDKSMLYTCKEALTDYEDIIDAACKLCDNLLYELEKVSENVSSFLFRNQDNKLKIKTDTDGVIDRDYRLDTYSMNQLDLFLKNKLSQIKKLLNVYTIAVGIKFDTAVDYIEQNIEILKMAKTYDSNKPEEEIEDVPDHEEPETDKTPNTEEPDDDSDNEPDDDDDFKFGEEDPDDDEEPIEEDDDFGDFEFGDGDEEPEMGNDVMDKDDRDFSEAYLFESELFELEMMFNEYEMHRVITEAVLLEEEQPTNPELKKVAAKASDPNFFQKIIAKIKELWERFRKKFFDTTKTKVEYIKKNKAFLDKPITGSAGLKYTPRFDLVDSFKIPDLAYTDTNFQKSLESDETFFKTYFKNFYPDDGNFSSVTDAIKAKVLGEEIPEEDINSLKTKVDITKARDFCLGYESLMSKLNAQMNILNKAERAAKDISKVQDTPPENKDDKPAQSPQPAQQGQQGQTVQQNSAYISDYNQYFIELVTSTKATDNPQKVNDLKTYFNVCTRALAAYMTVSHNLFIEMYAYCEWWILRAKGGNVAGNTEQKPAAQSTAKPAQPAASK